jgi:hypothetical protein
VGGGDNGAIIASFETVARPCFAASLCFLRDIWKAKSLSSRTESGSRGRDLAVG